MSTARANKAPARRTTKTAQKLVVLDDGTTAVDDGTAVPPLNVQTLLHRRHQQQHSRNPSTALLAHSTSTATATSPLSATPAGKHTSKSGAVMAASRVTAYCVSSHFHIPLLMQYLEQMCLHSERFDGILYARLLPDDLNDGDADDEDDGDDNQYLRDMTRPQPTLYREAFFMDYGVVVFWGVDAHDETVWLDLLRPFAVEGLDGEDVESEEFQCRYDAQRSPKIFNDIIILNDQQAYSKKMAISAAIGQSVKLSRFEWLVEDAIKDTAFIPHDIAQYGTVNLPRDTMIKAIGHLFNIRTDVNLNCPLLDAPDVFWSEPDLSPLYLTVRTYLEIPQRVKILNQRLYVINDMLDMLNGRMNKIHGEALEWIVIGLVFMSVVLAGFEIFFKIKKYADGDMHPHG